MSLLEHGCFLQQEHPHQDVGYIGTDNDQRKVFQRLRMTEGDTLVFAAVSYPFPHLRGAGVSFQWGDRSTFPYQIFVHPVNTPGASNAFTILSYGSLGDVHRVSMLTQYDEELDHYGNFPQVEVEFSPDNTVLSILGYHGEQPRIYRAKSTDAEVNIFLPVRRQKKWEDCQIRLERDTRFISVVHGFDQEEAQQWIFPVQFPFTRESLAEEGGESLFKYASVVSEQLQFTTTVWD